MFFITFSPRLLYCKNTAYNTYTEYVSTVYAISKASADWRPWVVKFEGSQKLYTDLQLHRESWALNPALFQNPLCLPVYLLPLPPPWQVCRFSPAMANLPLPFEIKSSWLSGEARCLSRLVISVKTSDLAVILAIPCSTLCLQTDWTAEYNPSTVWKTGEKVQKGFRPPWFAFLKVLACGAPGFSDAEYYL